MTAREVPWVLTGLSGSITGQEFLVDRPEMRLGRTPDNELVIPEPNVSRHHTSFFLREGNLFVRDLGSKNGTFVNEQRVTESALHPEDIIRVAEFRFRVSKDQNSSSEEADDEIPSKPRMAASPSRGPNRRALLYTTAGLILVAAFGSQFAGKLPSLPWGKRAAPLPAVTPVPTFGFKNLNATDEEIANWKIRADAAVGYDDMAAAVSLLRKIVSARPEDVRSRALLTRCEGRLRQLIATYDTNGAREFEKLYFDRAIREWTKVLAISQEFDPEAYRKAEKRIREAEEELTKRPR